MVICFQQDFKLISHVFHETMIILTLPLAAAVLHRLQPKETRTVTKVPHTPTQRLVTEQVSFYRKKIMEVP